MGKKVIKPSFVTGADAFADWRDGVMQGEPPTTFPVGVGELERLEIGPGQVWLLGGAPGAGKTALAMQLVVDALRLTPNLKAAICNIEMSVGELLNRQLARVSGVSLTAIRHRKIDAADADAIDRGLATLESLVERLAFVSPPYDLENVAAVTDEFGAELILMDYVQRIGSREKHADSRGSVAATMSHIRRFTDCGAAVIVVSAIGRSRDKSGKSTYDGDSLSLASFRESSELEFGADSAFILAPSADSADAGISRVTLRHLKNRHGEMRDIDLDFHGAIQRFSASKQRPSTSRPARPTRLATVALDLDALAELWARTEPAAEDAEGEE